MLKVGVLCKQFGENIAKLEDVICEEFNIKKVDGSYDPSALAKIFVKPNFKVLGRTLGNQMKDLKQALENISQTEALKALRKETIQVNGFILLPEHVIVELRGTGHDLVATDADLVVALDPTFTEELRLEGIARELVSLVQKARKSAQFHVEDRIYLELRATDELLAAIEKNKSYIEDETLSEIKTNLTSHTYTTDIDCEGQIVGLKLAKA